MTKRFRDLYRHWMADKKLDHVGAGRLLGVSRAASFAYAGGMTPPLSKVPLLAERLGLDEKKLHQLITREKAPSRKSP